MKTQYKILFSFLITLSFFSCKNEEPFSTEIEDGHGRIITSGLGVEVRSEDFSTRATSVPQAEEFTVLICKSNSSDEDPYAAYRYGDVPEIITLPVGDYVVKAFYGDDTVIADFDNPVYYGESEVIKVENGKIYNISDPIVCTLYNVRVAVTFDDELRKAMDGNVVVNVKVGENGSLDFTPSSTSDGFFKYDENSITLAATFQGVVNGTQITEIKNYDQVKRGTYYKITFKLRGVELDSQDPSKPEDPNNPNTPVDPETGNANSSIIVDATVTFHDNSTNGGQNVDPEKEEYLEDERFPGNKDPEENPGNDPNEPGSDVPEVPDQKDDILPMLVSDDVDLNSITDISGWENGQSLAVKILTPTKLKKFVCTIDSSTLTPQELESVYLKSELDLINDTDLFEDLRGLGFPVGEDITNPQTKDADGNYVIVFDITQFVTMLNALGAGTHNFIFDLENEAGQKIMTLRLKS